MLVSSACLLSNLGALPYLTLPYLNTFKQFFKRQVQVMAGNLYMRLGSGVVHLAYDTDARGLTSQHKTK